MICMAYLKDAYFNQSNHVKDIIITHNHMQGYVSEY